MENQNSTVFFNEQCASTYDSRFAKLAPIREVLHFLLHAVFSELPPDAYILCVGVGTGSELIELAKKHPQWQFTVVEPSAPMLDVCRRRIEESGLASRCVLHEGYLSSLPASGVFAAATCLLVSQFVLQRENRVDLFREIAARLRPGGLLVSADLASDTSSAQYASLLELWAPLLKGADASAGEIENIRAAHGRDVAVLPIAEVEEIIAAGGFEKPVLFLQTLLIHAWYARRALSAV